ncbi:MAG TPA: TRAP transporter large permease [Burkholderiales bacterium]|nr:TRAP transporter large permease [Burkholderiales bacterium]
MTGLAELGMLAIFLIVTLSGMPIAFVLIALSLLYILISGDIPLAIAVQRMAAGLNSEALLALPFFFLAAEVMKSGGITRKLIDFAGALVGSLPGGLALIVALSSAIFAAMTGSALATVAAIGTLMFPAMVAAGYSKAFAAAVVAAASIMGPIIPPSGALILYGITGNVSVGKLLMAGVLPGLLMCIGLIGYIVLYAKMKGLARGEKKTFAEIRRSFVAAVPSLMMPVLVLGGIYGGIVTVTEAAVVSVFYALALNLFYREFGWRESIDILYRSGAASAGLFLIIAGGAIVSWIVAREQLPQAILEASLTLSSEPMVIFLVVFGFLLVLGCLMDNVPAIVILAPILSSLAVGLGYDPVHFGFVVVYTLLIGLLTPPLGMALFVTAGVAKIDVLTLSRAVIPFLLVYILIGVALMLVPQITLFLPEVMHGR